MYKLIVSNLAHKDLDNIVAYIAIQLSNPVAAANFLNDLQKHYEYLRNNPYIYQLCDDTRLKKESFRKVCINNYILIFKIDDDAKSVVVYRLFYSAQDYIKHI